MSLKGFEYGYGGFDPVNGNDDGGYGNFGCNEPSSATKKENGSTRDKLAITPLTCKQFIDAKIEQENFKVDDKELHNVILVGNVEHVETSSTWRKYMINDGTGIVECKQFVDNAGSDQLEVPMNTYVRIVGIAKDYNGQRSISTHKIFPITVNIYLIVRLIV